jgi:hypothetical protein
LRDPDDTVPTRDDPFPITRPGDIGDRIPIQPDMSTAQPTLGLRWAKRRLAGINAGFTYPTKVLVLQQEVGSPYGRDRFGNPTYHATEWRDVPTVDEEPP